MTIAWRTVYVKESRKKQREVEEKRLAAERAAEEARRKADEVLCSRAIQLPDSPVPSKRNRLRCVRCVNENRKKRKRLRWQAANYDCHCFDRAFLLAGACQRKRLRFLRFSFTQRTQRKRWLPLLRTSIPTGWRLRLLRENFTQQTQAPANRNARSKQWQS